MENPKTSAPYFTKTASLTFTLDSVNLHSFNSAWYDSHQFSAKVQLPLTYDEFDSYIISLVYYRLQQLSGAKIKYYNFAEMYMPSFIEATLSYVNNNFDPSTGLKTQWQVIDYEPLSLPEMLQVSNKLAIISRYDNDLVKGFPRQIDTGMNTLYIVEQGVVCSVSEIDPRSIGISAMICQRLSTDDANFSLLFRKMIVDQQYAVSEVLSANI